jgi:hypothetical protein
MKTQKVNGKNIVKRLKNKGKKSQKVSFSFRADIYEQFREVCQEEEVSMSSVLEELMKDFLDSYGIDIEG